MNKSSPATKEFKATCDSEEIPFKKPVNPPNTRWSGFFKNLDTILYLKKPLMNLFIESDNWSDFLLSSNEWKLIESVASLLKLFCETVQVFESESKPTMHRVIERIYTLNEKLGSFIIKIRVTRLQLSLQRNSNLI